MSEQRETEYVCIIPGAFGAGEDEQTAITNAFPYMSELSEPSDLSLYRFYKGGWSIDGMGYMQWETGEGIGPVEIDQDELKEILQEVVYDGLMQACRAYQLMGDTDSSARMAELAEQSL